jgi:protein-disulfide isomerase
LGGRLETATQFSDKDILYNDYFDAISWMAENGVINGYPDGKFRPKRCVSRAEFLKMMFKTKGAVTTDDGKNPFSDLEPNAWYRSYVLAGYYQNIIEGYEDGTFRPENCVSRVEAVKMAMEGMELDQADFIIGHAIVDYEDIDPRAWYAKYLANALDKKIVGLSHVTKVSAIDDRYNYRPNDSMTREEVAELLFRIKVTQDYGTERYVYGNYPNNLGSADLEVEVDYGTDPFLGYEHAPIVLVEFTDYQCPYCQRFAEQTLSQIKEKYIDTNYVKLVFKDFPLTSIHPDAHLAAVAARCAREQGGNEMYFKYHDSLFSGDNFWRSSLITRAEVLNLDTDEFEVCLDSEKYNESINADKREGMELGVNGTPTFYLNGKQISGAQPFSAFETEIEKLLSSFGG